MAESSAEQGGGGAGQAGISLVIKNPSSASPGDFRLHGLAPSATVLKVKQLLQREYPGCPDPARQKLIVAGQLTKDPSTLAELFKQRDLSEAQVMHLVVTSAPPPPTAAPAPSPPAPASASASAASSRLLQPSSAAQSSSTAAPAAPAQPSLPGPSSSVAVQASSPPAQSTGAAETQSPNGDSGGATRAAVPAGSASAAAPSSAGSAAGTGHASSQASSSRAPGGASGDAAPVNSGNGAGASRVATTQPPARLPLNVAGAGAMQGAANQADMAKALAAALQQAVAAQQQMLQGQASGATQAQGSHPGDGSAAATAPLHPGLVPPLPGLFPMGQPWGAPPFNLGLANTPHPFSLLPGAQAAQFPFQFPPYPNPFLTPQFAPPPMPFPWSYHLPGAQGLQGLPAGADLLAPPGSMPGYSPGLFAEAAAGAGPWGMLAPGMQHAHALQHGGWAVPPRYPPAQAGPAQVLQHPAPPAPVAGAAQPMRAPLVAQAPAPVPVPPAQGLQAGMPRAGPIPGQPQAAAGPLAGPAAAGGVPGGLPAGGAAAVAPGERRIQVALRIDLMLVLKLGLMVFLFGQDGSYQRIAVLSLFAVVVYLYQTGVLAPLMTWVLQLGQRALGAVGAVQGPRAAAMPRAGAGGAAGEGGGAAAVDRAPGAPGGPHGAANAAGGAAPRGLLLALKEIQVFVVGFITSLLPGFQPPELPRRQQQPPAAQRVGAQGALQGQGGEQEQHPHED